MARTVRTKVFQFSELNEKAKGKAKEQLHVLASSAHRGEFGDAMIFKEENKFHNWKEEHFNIKDYEFTQEGNIFFK